MLNKYLYNSHLFQDWLGIRNDVIENYPVVKIDNHGFHQLVGKNTYVYTCRHFPHLRQKLNTIKKVKLVGLSALFQNPLPALALTTTTVETVNSSGENNIRSNPNSATWAGARGDTTGLVGGTESDARISASYTTDAGGIYWVDRLFLNFDTSSIPTSATVESITLKLYFYNTANNNANTTSYHVVPSSQASTTALVNDDLDNVTFTSKGSIAHSSITGSAYNDITISDTDFLTLGGTSIMAVINSRDLNNSAPTGRNERSVEITQDAGGNPPQLQITYTLKGGSFFYHFV